MANEQRLIDANDFLNKALKQYTERERGRDLLYTACEVKQNLADMVCEAPTVDAVSRGVVDQIRWERDYAMKQLEEHGIPFGGIAPDVVKVVRCKDCKHRAIGDDVCIHPNRIGDGYIEVKDDDFCSYGERKDNESSID